MMLRDAKKTLSIVSIVIVCVGQSGCAQPPTVNVDLETACADVPRHGQFVGESTTLVENGVERDRVLGVLSCIATHPNVRPGVGVLAVRALCYLAADDGSARSLVIEIVKNEATDMNVVRGACRTVVYIADAETRRELLEFAKRHWPSQKASFATEALKDLGDEKLVTWIDQLKKTLPAEDVHHPLLDRLKRYVSIQKSVPEMLAYIESDATDIDRDWLVRQAMRHGATPGQVRSAALAYLHRMRDVSSSYQRALLVRGCEEYDIFRSEDVRQYKAIREHREGGLAVCGGQQIWDAFLKAKEAEFYGR